MIVKKEKLKKLNLTVTDVFIINCIYYSELELLDYARETDYNVELSRKKLIQDKHINRLGDYYEVDQKYLDELFGNKKTGKAIDIEKFIVDYRDLFPKGSNNNGYPYKGDKQGCIKKMKRFIKLNPEYSTDIILKATQKYINEKRKDNYDYMHLAHYFIEKNGVSSLGAFCEQIANGESESDFSNIINF